MAKEVLIDYPRKVSGRTRSSYLNVLDLDLRYLYFGGTTGKSLSTLLGRGQCQRAPTFQKVVEGTEARHSEMSKP